MTATRSLTLDAPSWHAVVDAVPDVDVPPSFRVGPPTPGPGRAATDGAGPVRRAAVARLRERGLLDDDDRPIAPLVDRLRLFSRPGLRVHVRTWWGDRAVSCDLAVGPGLGVGLVRLQRVHPGGGPGHVTDGVAVEVLFFPTDSVVEQVWRVVPPPVQRSVLPGAWRRTPPRGVAVGWPEGAALAAAVRQAHHAEDGPLSATRRARDRISDEVVHQLLARLGMSEEPTVLVDLATGLDGAVEVTLSAGPRREATAGPATVWTGTWWQAGDRLVAVAAAGGAADGWPRVRFADSYGPGLRTDVTRAVAQALHHGFGPRQARSESS